MSRLAKALIKRQGKITFCLTMIVKNESKNMVRLFESIRSIIDFISIDDTGSDDDTVSIIEEWGKKNGIPTTVHHTPFKNFEYNRNQAALHANATYPQATYLFLSDADFVWKIVDPNGKKSLYHNNYHVYQVISPDGSLENAEFKYPNTRIIKNNGKWKCELMTHELWVDSDASPGVVVDWLYIDDRNDGGSKTNKFQRDEKACREGLEIENVGWKRYRYTFYLAQTLKDLGRYDEALVYYKQVITEKGHQGQWSKYQLGAMSEMMGHVITEIAFLMSDKSDLEEIDIKYIKKWNPNGYSPEILYYHSQTLFDDAERYYLIAYKSNRGIIDPLYDLVNLLRQRKKLEQAYEWSEKLVKTKSTVESGYFSDPSIFRWKRFMIHCLVCMDLRKDSEMAPYLSILLNMCPHDPDGMIGYLNDGYLAIKNKEYWKIPNINYMNKTKLLVETMLRISYVLVIFEVRDSRRFGGTFALLDNGLRVRVGFGPDQILFFFVLFILGSQVHNLPVGLALFDDGGSDFIGQLGNLFRSFLVAANDEKVGSNLDSNGAIVDTTFASEDLEIFSKLLFDKVKVFIRGMEDLERGLLPFDHFRDFGLLLFSLFGLLLVLLFSFSLL